MTSCSFTCVNDSDYKPGNTIGVMQGGMLTAAKKCTTKQHVRPIFYQTQCIFITHHIKAPTFWPYCLSLLFYKY